MSINPIDNEVLEWAESISTRLGISIDEFIERSIVAGCDLWEGYFNSKLSYPLIDYDFKIASLASKISRKLQSKGLPNWLLGGTLLSAIRDDEIFLPWSRSINVGVTDDSISYDSDWNILGERVLSEILSDYEIISLDEISPELSIFCKIVAKDLPDKGKSMYICEESNTAIFGQDSIWEDMEKKGFSAGTRKNKMLEIQLFRTEKDDEGNPVLRSGLHPNGNTSVPIEWILPNKSYFYNDLTFYIPAKSKDYLDFTLGRSWTTPIVGVHSFRSPMTAKGVSAKHRPRRYWGNRKEV